VRYQGSAFADAANTLKAPTFTLVSAWLRYDIGRLRLALQH
jgi:hypothetical protein